MAERPSEPQAAAALFRILRDHLADEPEGRALLARFEKDPGADSEGLAAYLRRRLQADDTLAQSLAAAPDLPSDLRTVVYGGQVERIIQIAQAGTVIVSPPRARRSRRFWAGLTALVAVVVVGLGVGLALVWQVLNQIPPMPEESFNIVVAPFAVQDAVGNLTETPESHALSEWFFHEIEDITAEINQRHSGLPVRLLGPDDRVQFISGKDRDERAVRAYEVAHVRNATILVYGIVTVGENGYQVEPEFYVSPKGFGYGCEVAGPDRLGQPVTFTLPLEPGVYTDVNRRLCARVQALRYIMNGLTDYYLGDYDKAASNFGQARDVEDWQDNQGKEVVHLLIGSAQLARYKQTTNLEELRQAQKAFAEAYALNHEYARSYLGLGAVAYLQATLNLAQDRAVAPDSGKGQVDEEKLAEARYWYSGSLKAADQPTVAYVPVRAAYGLGQAYLVGYEYVNSSVWPGDQARRYFQQVIAAYENERAPSLIWFASYAHASLGRLAGLEGDGKTMSFEYRQAIKLLEDRLLENVPPYPADSIAHCWAFVATAEEMRGNLKAACDAYRQAIRIAGGSQIPPEKQREWQQELARLEKGTY